MKSALKILDGIDKSLESEHKWIAAEYSYFKDMVDELNDITPLLEQLDGAGAKFDWRKMRQDLRQASRAERRVDRAEKNLEKDVESLLDLLPQRFKDQMIKLRGNAQIAARELLKQASLFRGEVRGQVDKMGVDIDILISLIEKSKKQTDRGVIEAEEFAVRRRINENVQNILIRVKNTIEWIQSLGSSIETMQRLEREIKSLAV